MGEANTEKQKSSERLGKDEDGECAKQAMEIKPKH